MRDLSLRESSPLKVGKKDGETKKLGLAESARAYNDRVHDTDGESRLQEGKN